MKHPLPFLLFSMLFGIITPITAEDADKPFSIGYAGSSLSVQYDIAQENRYFTDEGVTVDLREYPSVATLVQAVGNRDISAGILPVATWLDAVTAGTPLTVIAGQQRETYQLVATKLIRKSLTGLEKVTDRRVGIISGSTSSTVYRASLAYAGFPYTINDKLLAYSSQDTLLQAIHDGTIEVGVIDNSSTPMTKDLVAFTLPIEAVASRTVSHLVVSPVEWSLHEKVYLKLLTALLRSQAYIQTHTEDAISIVKKRHPAVTDAVIASVVNTSTLFGDRDGILALETLLRKDKVLSANCKPLTHVNLEPYHTALSNLNSRFPYDGYYADQLLALGDFSMLPDCCR